MAKIYFQEYAKKNYPTKESIEKEKSQIDSKRQEFLKNMELMF